MFLLVLLTGKNTNVDVIAQCHRSLVSAAIWLELTRLYSESYLVFVIRSLGDRGGHRPIVVENDGLNGIP